MHTFRLDRGSSLLVGLTAGLMEVCQQEGGSVGMLFHSLRPQPGCQRMGALCKC